MIKLVFFFFVSSTSVAANLNAGWTVVCADNNCSPSVGAAFMDGRVCTAFLLSNDLVATNAHCLPANVSKPNDSCYEHMEFVFPRAGTFDVEKLECHHLEQRSTATSDLSWVTPDYAILKLRNSTDRPGLKISREGFKDNEPLIVRRVNFDKVHMVASISAIECKATMNSVFTPLVVSNFSPVVSVQNCSVHPGNSGSPLIDKTGAVRGIVSHGPAAKEGNVDQPLMVDTGIGTNFACLEKSLDGQPQQVSNECGRILTRATHQRAREALFEKAAQAMMPILKKRSMELGQDLTRHPGLGVMFYWNKRVKANGKSRLQLEPMCWNDVQPPQWKTPVSIQSRSLFMKVSVDATARAIATVEEEPYELNLRQERRTADTFVASGLINGKGERVQFDLRKCKP